MQVYEKQIESRDDNDVKRSDVALQVADVAKWKKFIGLSELGFTQIVGELSRNYIYTRAMHGCDAIIFILQLHKTETLHIIKIIIIIKQRIRNSKDLFSKEKWCDIVSGWLNKEILLV